MKKTLMAACAIAAMAFAADTKPAQAQELWIGQIVMGGWTFCPRSTTETHGQLLAISSNQAMFSLLGTQFGGDGRTTFGLPDLQGRSPLGQGSGAGLTPFPSLGVKGGTESVTLNTATMPSHNHTASSTATSSISANPGQATAGAAGKGLAGNAAIYSGTGTPSQGLMADVVSTSATTTIGNNGGSQPFQIRDPYQVIRFCIATFGIFPSRN